MSRATLSCLLVMSLTPSLASIAHARRLVIPPDADAVHQPPAGFAQPPPVSIEAGGMLAPPKQPDAVIAPSRAQVRAALLRARAQNLASFRAYYKGGVYPSNVYSNATLNVWRDEANHFCAAATIMVKSGNEALAIKLADENNFIKLGDVSDGEVMSWITLSGFTQAELALIQRPFRPVTTHVAPTDRPQLAQVDARLRKAETQRLLAKYKQIDAQLVAKQKQSVERATTRLLKDPSLAWQLVNATGA